ncbi:MAG: hypothetical protein V3T58_06505 [Candidatus Hydrothermarchaeales archaeon]
MKVQIDCKFVEIVKKEDYGYLNCNLRRSTTFSCPTCLEGLMVSKR